MGPIEKLLRDAWAVIENPKNRCIKHLAVDAAGLPVFPVDFSACKFCCYGAIYNRNADGSKLGSLAQTYLEKATKNIFRSVHVAFYNDSDPINNPPKIYAEAIRLAAEDDV